MKAYNLNVVTHTASFGNIDCIKLGEDGRGRKLTLVTCPKGIKDGDRVSLFAPKVGKPKIEIGGEDHSSSWLMRLSTEGAYVRGANGNVRVFSEHEGNVKVIAKGQGAFGDAGRTGTWDDFLIEVQPDTVLRIKPSRGDAHYLHVLENTVIKLQIPDLNIYDGFDITTNVDSYVRL